MSWTSPAVVNDVEHFTVANCQAIDNIKYARATVTSTRDNGERVADVRLVTICERDVERASQLCRRRCSQAVVL